MTPIELQPVFEINKGAGEKVPLVLDLKRTLRIYWVAERKYAANDYVRAPSLAGFAYQASGAGEAGSREPAWGKTLASTCTDGSLTWTAVAPGTNALDAISTAVWAIVSGDAVVDSGSFTNEEAGTSVSAGTAGAITYVKCTVTTGTGQIYIAKWKVNVE